MRIKYQSADSPAPLLGWSGRSLVDHARTRYVIPVPPNYHTLLPLISSTHTYCILQTFLPDLVSWCQRHPLRKGNVKRQHGLWQERALLRCRFRLLTGRASPIWNRRPCHGDLPLSVAQALAGHQKNTTAIALDTSDSAAPNTAISTVDIVISLIPYTLHALVVKAAINQQKSAVTTSYICPRL